MVNKLLKYIEVLKQDYSNRRDLLIHIKQKTIKVVIEFKQVEFKNMFTQRWLGLCTKIPSYLILRRSVEAFGRYLCTKRTDRLTECRKVKNKTSILCRVLKQDLRAVG